jgi:hypothetical protein
VHRRHVIIVAVTLGMVAVTVLGLCACGTRAPAPAASAPSDTVDLRAAWAAVGSLKVPLVSLVVINSPGFDKAERTYLSRCNVAWQTIRQACATQTAESSGDKGAKEVTHTVRATTSLWLRTESPSRRFAPLHTSVRALARRLLHVADLAEEVAGHDVDDAAAFRRQLESSAASVAMLADRVAARSVAAREHFGHDPTPHSIVSGLTADEVVQIEAIAQGSVWITEPLNDAMTLLQTPMPSWTEAQVGQFTDDMTFIRNECRNWMDTPAAGPTIALAYGEYVQGLRLLDQAAGDLTRAAQDLDYDAAVAAVDELDAASPHIERGIAGLRALWPSAF